MVSKSRTYKTQIVKSWLYCIMQQEVCIMLCILTSWLNYFFRPFSTFLVHFKPFSEWGFFFILCSILCYNNAILNIYPACIYLPFPAIISLLVRQNWAWFSLWWSERNKNFRVNLKIIFHPLKLTFQKLSDPTMTSK